MNYRGMQEASIVNVLEGKGTEEKPYEMVRYVVYFENGRMVTLGKVVALTPEERSFFVT